MVRSLEQPGFVVIVGPTASGKSALAMHMCEALGGEIISCDSVQVYRGLDVGSAKPPRADQQKITHHLIDIVDVGDSYDAGRFAKDARQVLEDVQSRGKLPVIAGGTGLYLRGFLGDQFHHELPRDERLRAKIAPRSKEYLYKLLTRLDPRRASELHPNDRIRIERAVELRVLLKHPMHELAPPKGSMRERAFIIYINPPPEQLRARIAERSAHMVEAGLLDEVEALLARGVSSGAKPMQSIGYSQACAYLSGDLPESELVPAIATATAQYAKRQRTWFKKIGVDMEIKQLDKVAMECAVKAVKHFRLRLKSSWCPE